MVEPLVQFAEALCYGVGEDTVGEVFSVVTLKDGQEVKIVGLDMAIYAKRLLKSLYPYVLGGYE